MARYDDDEFGEYYVEDNNPSDELSHILFGNDFEIDVHAQELFAHAMMDGDEQAYQDMIDYLWDQYGIDFEDAFDWEDFRAWYDAA